MNLDIINKIQDQIDLLQPFFMFLILYFWDLFL